MPNHQSTNIILKGCFRKKKSNLILFKLCETKINVRKKVNKRKSQPWMSMDLMMWQKRANKTLCLSNKKIKD